MITIFKPKLLMHNRPKIAEKPATEPLSMKNTLPEPVEQQKPESWEQQITELENYFAGIALPKKPVKLNNYTTIANVPNFVASHFQTLNANPGKRRFLPFLDRLQELNNILKNSIKIQCHS
jgi:hypothetical protein